MSYIRLHCTFFNKKQRENALLSRWIKYGYNFINLTWNNYFHFFSSLFRWIESTILIRHLNFHLKCNEIVQLLCWFWYGCNRISTEIQLDFQHFPFCRKIISMIWSEVLFKWRTGPGWSKWKLFKIFSN